MASKSVDPRVEAEKADAVARRLFSTAVMNSLLAGSAVGILYPRTHDLRLVAWIVAVLAINLLRVGLVHLARRDRSAPGSARRRLRFSALGSLLCGLAWSCLPAFLMDFATEQALIVCIVLFGITAGAALQGAARAWPVIAISTPVALAVIVKFLLLGTTSGCIIAADALLYLALVLRSSVTAEGAFTHLASLRWQADALTEDVKRQHEITQAAADRLFRLANHDPLTGAANRGAFVERLQQRLALAAERNDEVSLLLIDLDHFKAINDTLGHGAGDDVLRAVAARLEAFGAPDRFVARLGGDEFAVLRGDFRNAEADGHMAEAMIAALSAPVTVRGQLVNVGASIGLACYPEDAASGEELLARADLALYAAKYGGRRGWRRFDRQLLLEAELAHDIEQDLPAAMDAGTLEVWFQPQVETIDGRLKGLEALLRWRHPRLGYLSPPEIVAAAQRLRLSRRLSCYVLERACGALRALERLGLSDVRVAINISPRELAHYDLLEMVTQAVAAHAIDPGLLQIEITEEAVLANQHALATLARLRDLGVRLALDDFGTGNSSIAYLRTLRMDCMKIDRTFVSELAVKEGDRTLVRAIVSMGRSLGMEVLAEGVETAEQALVLRSLGCNLAQGYLYGAALPPADLDVRLAWEAERRAVATLAKPARATARAVARDALAEPAPMWSPII